MKKTILLSLVVISSLCSCSSSTKAIKLLPKDEFYINPIYEVILDEYYSTHQDDIYNYVISNRIGIERNGIDPRVLNRKYLHVIDAAGVYDDAYILSIGYGYSFEYFIYQSWMTSKYFEYEDRDFIYGFNDPEPIVYKNHQFYSLEEAFDKEILDYSLDELQIVSDYYDTNLKNYVGSFMSENYLYFYFDKTHTNSPREYDEYKKLIKDYLNNSKISLSDIKIKYFLNDNHHIKYDWDYLCYDVEKLGIYSNYKEKYYINIDGVEINANSNREPLIYYHGDDNKKLYTLSDAYDNEIITKSDLKRFQLISEFTRQGAYGRFSRLNIEDYFK